MGYLFVLSLIIFCQLYIYNQLFYLHIGGLLFMIMWFTDDGLVVFTYGSLYLYLLNVPWCVQVIATFFQ